MKLIVKSSKKPSYACVCVKIYVPDPDPRPCDPYVI